MDKVINILKQATNIAPLLAQLQAGRVIRNTLSIGYRILAVVMGLALLSFWVQAWRLLGELKFFGGLAFLIWQVAFPYAAFLAIKTLYLRAREIREYPDSDYIVVPVVAMLTKTSGEMIFIFLGVMSIPAMLLTWLGGGVVNYLLGMDLGFLGAGNIFFAGIFAFIMSWVVCFLALVLTQLLAEWTLALFSIANDVNILRRNAASTNDEPVHQEPVPVQEG